MDGRRIQACAAATRTATVEQRHHRFKEAIEQALLLRGSRDFDSRPKPTRSLPGAGCSSTLNCGAPHVRLQVEREAAVAPCQPRRLEAWTSEVDVAGEPKQQSRSGSRGIRYSVDSRLIRRAMSRSASHADALQVWYAAAARRDGASRLRGGSGKHQIPLPARHRLAGTEAGGLRALPLSRRAVSRPRSSGWPTTALRQTHDGRRGRARTYLRDFAPGRSTAERGQRWTWSSVGLPCSGAATVPTSRRRRSPPRPRCVGNTTAGRRDISTTVALDRL